MAKKLTEQQLLAIIRYEVISSTIFAIGHDEKSATLIVEFKQGGVYAYHPLHKGEYQNLLSADSLGKYFHGYIKYNKNITCTKLQ